MRQHETQVNLPVAGSDRVNPTEARPVFDPCVESMRTTRGRIETQDFPLSQGFYAVYLGVGNRIGDVLANSDGLIYIGTSKNLRQRDLGTHFTSGSTGFSTLRRTLGALLKDELGLRAEPRSPGASTTNIQNYRFDRDGEQRLTSWMHHHLEVGYCQYDTDRNGAERRLIESLRPPLNLSGRKNPIRHQIMALRAACRNEAARRPRPTRLHAESGERA